MAQHSRALGITRVEMRIKGSDLPRMVSCARLPAYSIAANHHSLFLNPGRVPEAEVVNRRKCLGSRARAVSMKAWTGRGTKPDLRRTSAILEKSGGSTGRMMLRRGSFT